VETDGLLGIERVTGSDVLHNLVQSEVGEIKWNLSSQTS
jgi:hypothetical protein